MKQRTHKNEVVALQRMIAKKSDELDDVLQKILLRPKHHTLGMKTSISIFHQRCKKDIVYLDATGSILRKSKNSEGPFYVYELVVRNPKKDSSPFTVATFLVHVTTHHPLFYIFKCIPDRPCETVWPKK